MFSSSKVSQSMIDAVNKVLGKEEPKPVVVETPNGRVPFAPAQPVESQTLSESGHEKVATPTGTKVYGSSYGNSKKARQDQTKHSVDDVKEPSKKDIEKDSTLYKKPDSAQKLYNKSSTQSYFSGDYNRNVRKQKPNFEEAKPDFLDMDKDGNKKESMKKAIADKGMKEELKGNQHKIDANNNNKIDAQDFKILQAKKKVKEEMSFTDRLLETVRKSDVPAYLRKAKGDTPLTVADAKGPKKDSISAPENLAKARNEEVKPSKDFDARNKEILDTKSKFRGEIIAKKAADATKAKTQKEEVELHENDLHDMAYKHGWEHKQNTYGAELHHPKHGSIGISRYGEWYHHDKETKATGKVKAHGKYDTLEKHLGSLKEGKFNQMDVDRQDREAALEKDGWKKMSKNVKDKGGNIHTPMSRARDLARASFNKIKSDAK